MTQHFLRRVTGADLVKQVNRFELYSVDRPFVTMRTGSKSVISPVLDGESSRCAVPRAAGGAERAATDGPAADSAAPSEIAAL